MGWFNRNELWNVEHTLHRILLTQEAIMATQKDAAEQLKAIGDKLDKIAVEENKLQASIATLTTAVEAGGNVTPELQAAIDDVKAKAQVLDDIVPDAPPTP